MGQFDRTPRRRRQNPSNDQPEKNEMKSYALAAIAAILLASNGAMGKRSLMEHHHDKEIVTTASAISGSSSYSSGHEAYTTAGTVTDVTGHAGAAAAIAGGVANAFDWKGAAFASSGALSESVVADGIVGVLAESGDVTATEGHGEAEAISAAVATGKAIIHKKKKHKPDDNPSHDDGDDDWKDDDWKHD